MNKALEFLKDYRKSIPDHDTYNAELDEAIKELEEAMKPKTCHGCFWWNYFYSKCDDHDNSLAGVGDYGCNRYEAKAEQC